MKGITNNIRKLWLEFVIFFIVTLELLFLFNNPFGVEFKLSPSQIIYLFILVLYLIQGISLVLIYRWGLSRNLKGKRVLYFLFKYPELVFVVTLSFFIFSYIFASNANMDYVQRFIAMGGKLNLAIDSHVERAASALKFLPLLAVSLVVIIFYRIRYPVLAGRIFSKSHGVKNGDIVKGLKVISMLFSLGAIFWTLLSVILFSFSFPSFVNPDGYPILAWVSLVPLFLVIEFSRFERAVFYGTTFGVLQAMLTNYWLGTFSLVSLQFVATFFVLYYVIFMVVGIRLYNLFSEFHRLSFIVFPVGWVIFDYLRTLGFLGYPWGIIGVTQYRFIPLIQIASVTGIWGIDFIVIFFNSLVANGTVWYFSHPRDRGWFRYGVALFILLFASSLVFGSLRVSVINRTYNRLSTINKARNVGSFEGNDIAGDRENLVRLALIQQNTDPRKNDYDDTFSILKRLTNMAMRYNPDMVVWSETAFVPNIRRWSREDPKKYELARLVREFLRYQRSLGVWLLTGNDDYSLSRDSDGKELRFDYNASVLFSPEGRRVKTYYKIKLVPFTEYFPYKKQLPGIYNLLLSFDVYLWEPGKERVVFHHPKFSFSTPICFEDAFPDEVIPFVRAGADVILNLSNDYWSLTPIEAKQHFINAIFRAVENKRPLVRATASGITGYVDVAGRVIKTLPPYREDFLIVDLPLINKGERDFTFYTRFGDWFPQVLVVLLLFAAIFVLIRTVLQGKKNG